MTCAACGRPAPGPLPPDSIAHIRRPRLRPVLDGDQEIVCLRCFWWLAEVAGIVKGDGLRERLG